MNGCIVCICGAEPSGLGRLKMQLASVGLTLIAASHIIMVRFGTLPRDSESFLAVVMLAMPMFVTACNAHAQPSPSGLFGGPVS
jgi:hypothetical protein